MRLAAFSLLGTAAVATLWALGCLAGAMWPMNHERPRSEAEILARLTDLTITGRGEVPASTPSIAMSASLLTELKIELVDDYATITTRNREVNERRVRRRRDAGVAALLSLTIELALVAMGMVMKLHG